MYQYFVDHPSDIDGDLMAWSQDHSCDNNQGSNSATDGDLDIAYALLLADKQWGSTGEINYRAEAVRVIDAIMDSEVDSSGSYLLMGDWTSPSNDYYYDATRSSDFMPGHLTAFHDMRPDDGWSALRGASYDIFQELQSGYSPATGLLPDFIRYPGSSPAPAGPNFLEHSHDGEYSYNACRVPWRVGTHFVTDGDADAAAVVGEINDWIQSATGGNPDNITAGYWLDGDSLPGSSYTSMAFVAPFGVAAMVGSGSQEWLNDLWAEIVSTSIDDSYFDDTIKLLSLIVMSGNWWAPEMVDCP
jgi:endo-1,4-beta-D-glucanase Y